MKLELLILLTILDVDAAQIMGKIRMMEHKIPTAKTLLETCFLNGFEQVLEYTNWWQWSSLPAQVQELG